MKEYLYYLLILYQGSKFYMLFKDINFLGYYLIVDTFILFLLVFLSSFDYKLKELMNEK